MERNRHQHIILKIGQKIKDLRIKLNLTQEDLSLACDLDVRTIQRIEKGQQNITLSVLFSLSESLQIKPYELIQAGFDEI